MKDGLKIIIAFWAYIVMYVIKGYYITPKKLVSVSIFDFIAWLILICISFDIIMKGEKSG